MPNQTELLYIMANFGLFKKTLFDPMRGFFKYLQSQQTQNRSKKL